MTNTGKKPTSFGWIIFWFVVFWPVGVLLLINRTAVDKSAVLTTGKGIRTASYILMGIGAISLIVTFAGEEGAFLVALLFGGGGIVVNRLARKTMHAGDQYKKYIGLVVNQNLTSIDNIASALNISYETAVKDLQEMISKGYFVGAYIDTNLREIVLKKNEPQHEAESSASSATQVQHRIVACGNCGANNRVVGQTGECEYCGSFLQ